MKTINKKVASLFLSVLMMMTVFAFGINSSYAASRISIYIDGDYLNMDEPPVIRDGRTLVPLRAVTEAVGCTVDYFAEDKRIVVYSPAGGDPLLVMTINDRNVTVNNYNGDTGVVTGMVVNIDVPPLIVGGRTMVPLKFIAETIGYDVEWDADTKTVYLFSGGYYESQYDDDFASDPSETDYNIFPEGIVYTEEYYLQGDSGDGFSSELAALALVWDNLAYTYDVYSNDGGPIFITLVDLQFIGDEECYIFEVKKGTYTSSLYAVGYSGNIYELR